ncbi:TetR/AcrR family transcriptional regulator [Caldimonas tepidiphila]|uniref:TetR/AcrR family transcriptional regulator n=1 Tax=Caldimonas tepidiphila TaxID=2315841 RepID=UPI001F0C3DB3|nr:TetR/AcrR family transcriptional regulator [Caldimonas tepidiphila]
MNQKRRTQQALMEAALALRDEGREPTLQQVAERAQVSRATAYRYFGSLEALLAMARFEHAVPPLDAVLEPGGDPVAAIGRACEHVNRALLDDEQGVHVLARSAMQVWLDGPPEARPPRPARRLQMIEPILDACGERLDAAARRRLRAALSLVIGVEAVLSLRDVAGESREGALEAARWAAETLLRAALAEGEGQPRD